MSDAIKKYFEALDVVCDGTRRIPVAETDADRETAAEIATIFLALAARMGRNAGWTQDGFAVMAHKFAEMPAGEVDRG
jgi:hypothetical protein